MLANPSPSVDEQPVGNYDHADQKGAVAVDWIVILSIGVGAGVIGGVVGFGASLLLMPVLVLTFGGREAVPIMALAALLANASRAAMWWREIDWRVNAVYCATAIPAAMLGARLLLQLDHRLVEATLGAFFILMVPVRRWLIGHGFRIRLPGMAVVGAVIGFITGLVATTGPINTPFFLAYGLTKGAFLATEAVGAGAISLTKAIVFRSLGALPWETIMRGLAIGSSLMLGSAIAKRIVERMNARHFSVVLEAMMGLAGLGMLIGALN